MQTRFLQIHWLRGPNFFHSQLQKPQSRQIASCIFLRMGFSDGSQRVRVRDINILLRDFSCELRIVDRSCHLVLNSNRKIKKDGRYVSRASKETTKQHLDPRFSVQGSRYFSCQGSLPLQTYSKLAELYPSISKVIYIISLICIF